jgi:predicted metalloprotease
MRTGYAKGDSWVYLIIAHEWGHAIQNRLKNSLVAQQKELQADCLAGAALYGAAEKDRTPRIEPGDHGDAFQRIENFSKGRTGGVKACFTTAQGA